MLTYLLNLLSLIIKRRVKVGKFVRFCILLSIVFSILFVFSVPSFAKGVYYQTNNGKVWDSYPETGQTPVWTGPVDSNGYASGQGVLIWYQDGQPGDKYEGTMVEGKMSGKGTYTWSEGTKYVGDFVDDMKVGKGVVTWTNGDKYVGDFSNNSATGKGTYTWVNKDKYTGDFVNYSATGKGVYTWADGTKYIGDFVDFYRDGYGTYYDKNGNVVYQGKWSKDQFMGNK
jgi:hypothetical protein